MIGTIGAADVCSTSLWPEGEEHIAARLTKHGVTGVHQQKASGRRYGV
jgi:hypothetical protein